MRTLLLIALLAVASAAEAQNVVPEALAPAAPQQAPAPVAPPPAPARPPSAPRPAPAARPAPGTIPAAPEPPQPAQAPRPAAPPANIRFDVTITDTGAAKPVTKTLSLTVGNNNNSGSIRSTAQVPGTNPNVGPFVGPQTSIPLNVDVRNVISVDNNSVRASVLIEYQPYVPEAKSQPGGITASAQTIFFDGRKTQILVTSDPVSDRKTTIEVTATILK
jgi:hypothetical protein